MSQSDDEQSVLFVDLMKTIFLDCVKRTESNRPCHINTVDDQPPSESPANQIHKHFSSTPTQHKPPTLKQKIKLITIKKKIVYMDMKNKYSRARFNYNKSFDLLWSATVTHTRYPEDTNYVFQYPNMKSSHMSFEQIKRLTIFTNTRIIPGGLKIFCRWVETRFMHLAKHWIKKWPNR